jgi:bis(5'-nucleosyl)-tetraphosphatase (symmetrical)
MNRLIVYGDIHGCYDELVQLRKKIKPNKDDIEVCVGDIITRGKNSIKTLRYLQNNDIKSVLGNHEDKLIRYLGHQQKNGRNPITLDKDEHNIVAKLNNNDIKFLSNMPLFMKFNNIVILHGGLQNHHDLNNISKKTQAKILRMRFLNKNHNFISFGQENQDSIFWADIYNGNQGFVVYGHQRFDKVKINDNSIGIDTSCVYGNKLTAVIFSNFNQSKYKIVSVDFLKDNKI